MKGHLSKRTQFVREIVKEVSGYALSDCHCRLYAVMVVGNIRKTADILEPSLAPYERRVIELLRNSKDKRARKLAKKRLGTFGRAKSKVDELQRVIAESRRAGH
jgi:large subunit ribosomal protein L36e